MMITLQYNNYIFALKSTSHCFLLKTWINKAWFPGNLKVQKLCLFPCLPLAPILMINASFWHMTDISKARMNSRKNLPWRKSNKRSLNSHNVKLNRIWPKGFVLWATRNTSTMPLRARAAGSVSVSRPGSGVGAKINSFAATSLGHSRSTGIEGGLTEIAQYRTQVCEARCQQEPGVRPGSPWEIYTFFTRR